MAALGGIEKASQTHILTGKVKLSKKKTNKPLKNQT